MRKLTLFAAAILWLCLLAGACDQGPGLCSIFNTNANACAPPNTGSGGGSNLGQ